MCSCLCWAGTDLLVHMFAKRLWIEACLFLALAGIHILRTKLCPFYVGTYFLFLCLWLCQLCSSLRTICILFWGILLDEIFQLYAVDQHEEILQHVVGYTDLVKCRKLVSEISEYFHSHLVWQKVQKQMETKDRVNSANNAELNFTNRFWRDLLQITVYMG